MIQCNIFCFLFFIINTTTNIDYPSVISGLRYFSTRDRERKFPNDQNVKNIAYVVNFRRNEINGNSFAEI